MGVAYRAAALRQRRRRLSQFAADARSSTTVSSARSCAPSACRPIASSASCRSKAACRSKKWPTAGRETLAFGPMRAVGLIDPRTGRRPYAVVQLRQENREQHALQSGRLSNQDDLSGAAPCFRVDPGLGERGVRPSRQPAPQHLHQFAAAFARRPCNGAKRETLFFAGQMTGVEGYIESAATGLLAGINAANLLAGKPAGDAAHDHRAGSAFGLHHRSGAQALSADERELRLDPAAGGVVCAAGRKKK